MTTEYSTFYSNWKVETINNESDINDIFESIYTTIISNIQKFDCMFLSCHVRVSE